MNFIRPHIQGILIQDTVLCNPNLKINTLPRLTKVVLSAKFDGHLGSTHCLLQLLGLNTPAFTQNKQAHLNLNLKKGEVVGCKLSLRKEDGLIFLEWLFLEILPSLKSTKSIKVSKNCLFLHIGDVFNIDDLNNHYSYLHGQRSLDVVVQGVHTNAWFFKSLRLNTES